MVKCQQSATVLLILLLLFIAILFLIKTEVPETTTPPTTTTIIEQTTTTVPTTTTATTMPPSNCTGVNINICALGTKYDCTIHRCCYWDLNISKCKPKPCSDMSQDVCISCMGCKWSQ